jgi:hypothetical protein
MTTNGFISRKVILRPNGEQKKTQTIINFIYDFVIISIPIGYQ